MNGAIFYLHTVIKLSTHNQMENKTMNRTNPILFYNASQEHGETNIKSFAQKIGEETGQIVSDFLTGILLLVLVDRPPDSKQSPEVKQRPNSERSEAIKQASEKLLTGSEVAERLNISKAKAYKLMSAGRISSVRFDKTVRVRKQDLEKFVDDHIVRI
jgi:excisionase family DNA binding protein